MIMFRIPKTVGYLLMARSMGWALVITRMAIDSRVFGHTTPLRRVISSYDLGNICKASGKMIGLLAVVSFTTAMERSTKENGVKIGPMDSEP